MNIHFLLLRAQMGSKRSREEIIPIFNTATFFWVNVKPILPIFPFDIGNYCVSPLHRSIQTFMHTSAHFKLHPEPSKQLAISEILQREMQICKQQFPSPKTMRGGLYLGLHQPKNLYTADGKHCHQISSLYTWWTPLK